MKNYLFAAVLIAAVAAAPARAQPKAAVISGDTVEALITVLSVDQKKRTVVVRGPRGNVVELQVPPEAQNLDKVKPGSVFRVKYTEALAVAITQGGEPDRGDKKGVAAAAKGATPGGVVVRVQYVSGRVEAIDPKNRYVAIRGPKQNTYALKAADDVKLDELHVGDRITIAYSQALALEMVPEPVKPKAKPKAAAKKQ